MNTGTQCNLMNQWSLQSSSIEATPIETTPSQSLNRKTSHGSTSSSLVIDEEEVELTPPSNKRLKLYSVNEEDIMTLNIEETIISPSSETSKIDRMVKPHTIHIEDIDKVINSNASCIERYDYVSSLPSWDDMRDNELGHSAGDNQTVTNEVSALISQDSQVTSSVDDKLSKHYQMFDSNSYNKKLINRNFTHHHHYNSSTGKVSKPSHQKMKHDDRHMKHLTVKHSRNEDKHHQAVISNVSGGMVKKSIHHSDISSHTSNDKRHIKDRKHHHGDEHRHHTYHSTHKRRHTPTDDRHYKKSGHSPHSHHYHDGRSCHQRSPNS